MALTPTTLAAPMSANDLSMRVASVAGAVVGGVAKVDNEYSTIVQVVSPIVSVRTRGDQGGSAIDHDTNAPVVFGIGSEFPSAGRGEIVPAPTEERDVISIGSDMAIGSQLKRDAVIVLTKGSVAAVVLEAPNLASDGLSLVITSQSAFAHVVTGTGLLDNGVTGGAKNTLTFAAFPGATVSLVVSKGHYTVVGASGVTVG